MTTVESKIRRTLAQPYTFIFLLRENLSLDYSNFINHIHTSCEEVCKFYPHRINKLFSSINLDYPGLDDVNVYVKKQNWSSACSALLEYYRENNTPAWLRQACVTASNTIDQNAELILQDTFTFQLATEQVPRHKNGSLNWSYRGSKDDREWAWFLNRHYHLLELFEGYQKTGNLDYITCINTHIIDWIISNPSLRCLRIWAQWRGIEASYRLIHWAPIFYGLQQVTEFSPAARILMLSSILNHAQYLRLAHDWGDNWVAREMRALGTVAIHWPEFKSSPKWLAYASDRLQKAACNQVYPDGTHKELTSHYHNVVLRDFRNFADDLTKAGYEVPAAFDAILERMTSYLAYSMRPDGYCVVNNDSDQESYQALVIEAAKKYERPDWIYIATHAQQGQKPLGEPSVVFPWAGQVIMRSSWATADHWAFFDVGPLGINYHVHHDKLHLSLMAYGRDLLVDSGRYSYVKDRLWPYFRDSTSHNVILIDGQGQKSDVREWQQPMIGNYAVEPEYDFAQGTCDRGFAHFQGNITHSRALLYLRNHYWVVIDQINTDRPCKIDALWHFHPDCTVEMEGGSVVTVDQGVGNLRIVPTPHLQWQAKIAAGQEDPFQGWWSREYNHIIPNPTVIYSTEITTSTIFGWVLYPAKGLVPNVVVDLLPAPAGSIRLTLKAPDLADEIAFCMNEQAQIELSDNLILLGKCAILRLSQPPLVQGKIIDSEGKVVALHPPLSQLRSQVQGFGL
jgi:hypothetical protein